MEKQHDTSTSLYNDYLETPIGLLVLHASNNGLTHLLFTEKPEKTQPNIWTERSQQQLDDYFSGKRQCFDITLDVKGTEFQKKVWERLQHIPYGKTKSYIDIANEIHNNKAVRAVGAANGRNPISIIVPCHRVIGKNKTLTGYAGGLERKDWLLKHEGIDLENIPSQQLLFS